MKISAVCIPRDAVPEYHPAKEPEKCGKKYISRPEACSRIFCRFFLELS